MKWTEIEQSEKWASLTPQQRRLARERYFDEFVAPNAPETFDPDELRTKWMAYSDRDEASRQPGSVGPRSRGGERNPMTAEDALVSQAQNAVGRGVPVAEVKDRIRDMDSFAKGDRPFDDMSARARAPRGGKPMGYVSSQREIDEATIPADELMRRDQSKYEARTTFGDRLRNRVDQGFAQAETGFASLPMNAAVDRLSELESTGDVVLSWRNDMPQYASDVFKGDAWEDFKRRTREEAQGATADFAASTAMRNRYTASLPQSPARQYAQKTGDWKGGFLADPLGYSADAAVPSAVAMAPALAVAGVARNPVAGAAIMGLTGFTNERAGSMVEYLAEQGIDTSNEDAIRKALSNPEIFNAADKYATTRAAIIAPIDAVGAGLASRTLAPGVRGFLRREAVNTLVGQPVTQAAIGGAGEAAAGLATKGRISGVDVFDEVLGQVAMSPAETAPYAIDRVRNGGSDVIGNMSNDALREAANNSAATRGERMAALMELAARGDTADVRPQTPSAKGAADAIKAVQDAQKSVSPNADVPLTVFPVDGVPNEDAELDALLTGLEPRNEDGADRNVGTGAADRGNQPGQVGLPDAANRAVGRGGNADVVSARAVGADGLPKRIEELTASDFDAARRDLRRSEARDRASSGQPVEQTVPQQPQVSVTLEPDSLRSRRDAARARNDFDAYLQESGQTPEALDAASAFDGDRIPQPSGEPVAVGPSRISGQGIIATDRVTKPVTLFDLSADGPVRTDAGRYVNHSPQPNADVKIVQGRIVAVPNREIQPGQEVTINYREIDPLREQLATRQYVPEPTPVAVPDFASEAAADPDKTPEAFGLPKPLMPRGKKRTARDFDENYDDALDFLALNGGLDRAAWASQGVDPDMLLRKKGNEWNKRFAANGPTLFPARGGMTPDQARELLQQRGFFAQDVDGSGSEANDAIDLVMESINQGRVFRTQAGSDVDQRRDNIRRMADSASRDLDIMRDGEVSPRDIVDANDWDNRERVMFSQLKPASQSEAFRGMTREQFLGDPHITRDSNAADLKPKALDTVRDSDPVPFAVGEGLTARYSPDGAAVYDGGNVIASYNFGDTLVVEKKRRRQGIGEELVYQWRTRYPDAKPAASRTKSSQSLQEKVWRRIQREQSRILFSQAEGIESSEISQEEFDSLMREQRARMTERENERMVSLAPDEFTRNVWQRLSEIPELAQNPKVSGSTPSEVVAAAKMGAELTGITSGSDESGPHQVHYFKLPDRIVERDGRRVTDKGGVFAVKVYKNAVEVNVSDLKPGENGSRIYNAVAGLADSTGKLFRGDTQGLSDWAILRRTENMVSNALKYGADTVAPHPRQTSPGGKMSWAAPLKWTPDPEKNLSNLLLTSAENVARLLPEIDNYTYNWQAKRFEDANGNRVDKDDLDALSVRAGQNLERMGVRARDSDSPGQATNRDGQGVASATPFGRNSIARAILTRSLVRSTGSEGRSGILAATGAQRAELSLDEALRGITYSQPTRVPNQPDATRGRKPAAVAGAETRPSGIPKSAPSQKSMVTTKLGNRLRDFGINADFERVALPDALASTLDALGRITGRNVVVFRVTKGKFNANGFVLPGDPNIYVNADSASPVLTVASHEFLHQLRKDRPDLYSFIAAEVEKRADMQAWREELDSRPLTRGKNRVSDESLLEELVADGLGDAMSDPQFLASLAKRNPTKFRDFVMKALDYFSGLLRKIGRMKSLGSDQYLSDIQGLRDAYAQMLDDYDAGVMPDESEGVIQFQSAWHGTPHTVDRFRLDKIGTGEGAQAYGWGMYFASKKEVAESYKRVLEKREYDIDDPAGIDASFWMQGVTRQQAIQNVESALANPPRSANAKVIADWKADLAYLKSDKPIPQVTKRSGNLYSVDIPEDSDLLDWDKPLSEQPEKVRERLTYAVVKETEPSDSKWLATFNGETINGFNTKKAAQEWLDTAPFGDIYRAVSAGRGPSNTSTMFAGLGIPGLRYLDGNSRGNGEGSHNYVIWDEAAIGEPVPQFSQPRKQSDSGFYSAMVESVTEGKGAPKRADANAWKQWLDGAQRRGEFKQSERDWIGVDAWLDGRATTTRDELAEFVRTNQVEVQETDLGADGETKFAQYTLPGGKNYRELLLTLPVKTTLPDGFSLKQIEAGPRKGQWAVIGPGPLPENRYGTGATQAEAIAEFGAHGHNGPTYKSSHFDKPNILAHARFNERTDADGKRVLFVEEVQSDWHQAGRKRGYQNTGPSADSVAAAQRSFDESAARNENAGDWRRNNPEHAAVLQSGFRNDNGVPDAPLKKEWPLTAMKRMIRWASENGFDRIAWTTGDQQAERYDLSKQISKIEYIPTAEGVGASKPGVLRAWDLNGRNVLDKNVPPDDLADHVGKDVAERLLSSEPAYTTGSGKPVHRLEGLDLKIGGDGMRAFYDKMLPNELGKYVKKWGGKVGQGQIEYPVASEKRAKGGAVIARNERFAVHSIDITPAMRDAAMEGQPLFSQPKTPSQAAAENAQKRATVATATGAQQPVTFTYTDRFEGPIRGRLNKLREWAQDKMLSALFVQEDIKAARGAIADAVNVYRRENLMHGRTGDQLETLKRTHVDPLVKAIKAEGLDDAVVEDYLEAKFAPERNKIIAAKNPNMPDGGSGMTDADAADFLAGKTDGFRSGRKITPADTAKLQRIAAKIQALRAETLDRLESSGLINAHAKAAMLAQAPNYVPLRGKDGVEITGGRGGAGKGIDVRGKPIKEALGRGAGNRAVNILAEMIADAERSIVQAEKNRVGKTLARLVLENPNPDLWEVEPVRLEQKLDSVGQVYQAVQSNAQDQDAIRIMHDGKPYFVRLSDPKLRDAMKNLGVDNSGAVIKFMGGINRYFSAVLTRYNPSFIAVNALRDLGFGMTGIAAEHGVKVASSAAAKYPAAMRAMWRDNRGTLKNTAMDRYAREFSEAGGKTFFAKRDSVEEISSKVAAEFKSYGKLLRRGQVGLAWNKAVNNSALLKVVNDANDAVENAMRLSAYAALRESGKSVEQAAEYAKNITVNFNRKGQVATAANAVILFYNAATQGAHRSIKLLRNPKVIAAMGGLAGLQALLAAYAMGSDDEDDDGLTAWEKIPAYEKERNLIIPIVGVDAKGNRRIRMVKWPMPYGFNVFSYAGGRMAELAMTKEPKPAKFANDMGNAVVNAFSPVKFIDGMDGIKPHFMKIFDALGKNEDDLGMPIRVSDDFDKFPKPRAYSGKADTPEAYKAIAKGLNAIGGGDEVTPPKMFAGMLDWAPEDLEYLTEQLTGGLGRFASDSYGAGEKLFAGIDTKPTDYPVLRSIVGEVDQNRATQGTYYDRGDEIEREKARLRLRFNQGGIAAANKLIAETPELQGFRIKRFKSGQYEDKNGSITIEAKAGLAKTFKDAEKEVKRLNTEIRAAQAQTFPSLKAKSDRIKELQSQREKAQREFNEAFAKRKQ